MPPRRSLHRRAGAALVYLPVRIGRGLRAAPRAFMHLAKACAALFGPQEIALVLGLCLIGYGLSLVYWPAAFVVPGAILVMVAVFGIRRLGSMTPD